MLRHGHDVHTNKYRTLGTMTCKGLMVYQELSFAPPQFLVSDTQLFLAFSAGKVVAGPAVYV